MKNLVRATLLTFLLLLSGLCDAAPKTQLRDALTAAEAFVAQNKIPNADRYLAGATWHEDYMHPEKSHWIISWNPVEFVTDHLLVVRVYPDGRITYQDSWT